MESEIQSRSLKLTIKLKGKSSIVNSSASDENLKNMDGELNASNCSAHPSQNEGDISPSAIEDRGPVDKEKPSSDNSHLQLVLYDSAGVGVSEAEIVPDPIRSRPLSFRSPRPFSNQTRVTPFIGAFAVQCANCFKWRLIPTKEKYEEIREHIMGQPFVCETAQEWRPEISCDDPADIMQDDSRLWAIDKPSIAQPPPGWQRLLRIRGEGGTRFADVYYVAPSGKRLRSMVEIQRYLNEHPQYVEEGVRLSQFSFQTPKPMQDNYVRKRPAHPATPNDGGEVKAIEWREPSVDTGLHLSGPRLSTPNFEAAGSNLEIQSPERKKKRKRPSKPSSNDLSLVYNQNGTNVDGTQ